MSKSPFPGMDPYLEGEWWQDFHDRLANQISTQLMAVLPEKYVALLKRYYVIDYAGLNLVSSSGKRGIYPDVHVAEVRETTLEYEAIAMPSADLLSPLPEKIPLLRVEIRDVVEHRLVTVIEILSPANKIGTGFNEYVDKRTALLRTETHLLELDLLRFGERIPLIGGELPPAPYYIFLSRFNRRPHTEVWPVQLSERLPTVPVPLLPPDVDVPLILQHAVQTCFEVVRYHERLLDYTQPPPPPPLKPDELEWVQSIIKQEGKK